MPINESSIEKIAQLAHLEISREELLIFAPQIAEIVTYVEQLSEVDTSSIDPAIGGLTPEARLLIHPELTWSSPARSEARSR
jgi:aspartyl-tRNA(Asn)/glutamyl-tRNA(Gln) amidotransferase subunit C